MADNSLSRLPSVDRLLASDLSDALIPVYGRPQVTESIRAVLESIRKTAIGSERTLPDSDAIMAFVSDALRHQNTQSLRPVLNLTGTVLHTNLGRAPLPDEAIEHMALVANKASNLEFSLERGDRGDRDDHIEPLIRDITGAEAATVVNNNAAAVLLCLNALALGKEVPVSRGELVEIGGSFRIPDIMARAGCHLIEVGTTNRTHLADYERAISEHTGLLMKVHTSNYEIRGFTNAVGAKDLGDLAARRGLPFVMDLGSGTLIDMTRYGLPAEPTVQSALANGADVVTFSGDKLLGGPQAGIIAGRRELIDRIKSDPLKRALRIDKMTLAALFEVLKLYRDPDHLIAKLPTLRLLARPAADIERFAQGVLQTVREKLARVASVEVIACDSQIGSGSLPTSTIPSFGLQLTPLDGTDAALTALAAKFRQLSMPVIGRIHDGHLILDLRTLEDANLLTDQMDEILAL